MKKSTKYIILCILFILSVVGIVLEICLLYPKSIKTSTNTNNSDKENNGTGKDVYSKYSDIEWAKTSIVLGNDSKINIVDGKLECDNVSRNLCDLFSTINEPIIKIINGRSLYTTEYIYILTESGKVYTTSFDYYTGDQNKLEQILKDYKIVDLTQQTEDYSLASYGGVDFSWNNSADYSIFYLTEDGKLINKNGQIYEDINKNFVYSSCFASTHYSYELCLYFTKENNVYYRAEKRCNDYKCGEITDFPKNANYTSLKNNSNSKLVAKRMYDILPLYDERDTMLIVDVENNLYEIKYGIDEGNIDMRYIGKIESTTFTRHDGDEHSEEYYSVYLNLLDGNEYIFDTKNIKYLNVLSHSWMNMENSI